MKKNFVLITTTTLAVILSLNGCGSSSLKKDREIIKKIYTTPIVDDKKDTPNLSSEDPKQTIYNSKKQKEEENKNDNNCKHTNPQNSQYILDPTSECQPNIDLYHNENGKGYFTYKYDDSYKGYVIDFHSQYLDNAIHILGYDAKVRYDWAEYPEYQHKYNISWDAKFSNDFIIYVVVKFTDENNKTIEGRDLVYTPTKNGYEYYTKEHMHISLGENAKDGKWHTYNRNILDDIRVYYPNATINYDEDDKYNKNGGYVNGIAVKGSGQITNIKLSK